MYLYVSLRFRLMMAQKNILQQNLFDPAVTKDMFQELYFYRWPVELKYKELKKPLCHGRVFRCYCSVYTAGILYKYAFIESGLPYKKMKQMRKYRFLPKAQISSVISQSCIYHWTDQKYCSQNTLRTV